MQEAGISRRSFLRTAGLAGLAAGALGAVGTLGAPQPALADEAAGAQGAEGAANAYLNVFGEDTAYIPVKKAKWSQLSGPIAFEDRAIDAAEIAREEQCDFLVVGCGLSGMAAMLKAASEGASVIGIEKMSQGRHMWESVGGYNTSMQRELGNVPDPAEYVEAILRASQWRARPDVVWSFVNNSGEAVDFLNEQIKAAGKGVELYGTIQKPAPYGMETIQAEHKIKIPEGVEWKSWFTGSLAWDSLVTTAATYDNLDIRYNTAGVQLTRDGSGRVDGIVAKDADGYYAIKAAKGVLLSTGGYEANPGMVEAFIKPEEYQNACVYAPCLGPTGDGHMMGLSVGAQMDAPPHTLMSFRSGLPDRVLDSTKVSSVFGSSIWINHQARRFANEALPHNFAANVINAQTAGGKSVWFMFDQGIVDRTLEKVPELPQAIEELKADGLLVEGETVADLAKAMGVDADELQKTVDTFNSYFEADEPADLMFRRDIGKLAPLATGPYYACVHVSKVLVSANGLIINENAQVLDEDEQVIPGLYAAGNTTGGMFIGMYPRHLPSTSTGRCATMGFVAARHAIKGE
ncbi:FAD-dependent oxidoreductase [Arabiibacter massiliensis]|uniref:FAD-dependent oxidoreductase n=1 Tax=Arabiibacter massiliensis TaxID=1870985 RepID=UPI00155ACF79|nr:FAD-binding protein [Arabiibacter massiliensis]